MKILYRQGIHTYEYSGYQNFLNADFSREAFSDYKFIYIKSCLQSVAKETPSILLYTAGVHNTGVTKITNVWVTII